MLEYKKPIPVPSVESKPYWEGLKNNQLLMQRCDDCGKAWFPPAVYCPHCGSGASTWMPMSGRGKVYSYVVYHRVYNPAFAEDIPYTVGVIELEEGPRMISNVIGIAPAEVVCEMPVEIVFDRVSDAIVIPKFKPRRA